MKLDERKQKIMLAIVQDYISTAEPVGSRTIARKYNLGVSAATIRNEMADLEENGFLEQPHASAGRIPSDLGYRYYVDYLMKKEELSPQDMEYAAKKLHQKVLEIEAVVRTTGDTLSEISNYVSVIVSPQLSNLFLRQVHLVPLGGGSVLLVAVLSGGIVQHRIFEVPPGLTPDDLQLISHVLSEELNGVNLETVRRTILASMKDRLSKYRRMLDNILELLETITQKRHQPVLYLGGTLNIFNQPEFHDVTRVQQLLKTLTETEALGELLEESIRQGLTVKIGEENNLNGLKTCSFISTGYRFKGEAVGSIGLLGPTRMDYSRGVSLVEFMAEQVSQALEKIYRG